jgi:hypothetical protein
MRRQHLDEQIRQGPDGFRLRQESLRMNKHLPCIARLQTNLVHGTELDSFDLLQPQNLAMWQG